MAALQGGTRRPPPSHLLDLCSPFPVAYFSDGAASEHQTHTLARIPERRIAPLAHADAVPPIRAARHRLPAPQRWVRLGRYNDCTCACACT
eukprot:364247-Chlamydomonas_euryale.AAC.3